MERIFNNQVIHFYFHHFRKRDMQFPLSVKMLATFGAGILEFCAQNYGNAIYESFLRTYHKKICGGSMPPDRPSKERLLRSMSIATAMLHLESPYAKMLATPLNWNGSLRSHYTQQDERKNSAIPLERSQIPLYFDLFDKKHVWSIFSIFVILRTFHAKQQLWLTGVW